MTVLTRSVVEALFATQPARLARILEHSGDLYDGIAGLTGLSADRAKEILGNTGFRRLTERARNPRFRVSEAEAQAIRTFYSVDRHFDAPDSVLVDLIPDDLARLLQSDHLVEQRFVEEIIIGNISFSRRPTIRSLGRDTDRMADIHAVAVPTNEIIYYRIARLTSPDFRLAGLYPHVGPGSKTTRMRQLIPPGTEAAHSIMDIVNAHLWVTITEQGLPRQYRQHILHDVAVSLRQGLDAGPMNRTLQSEAVAALQDAGITGGPTQANLIRYFNHQLGSSRMPTLDTFSPALWPRYLEAERPLQL